MKKHLKIVVFAILLIIVTLDFFKPEAVYYIPFDIPGSQMAVTVPPFGIFIEEKHKKDGDILKHEKIHWKQYKEMELFVFYGTYLSEFLKYGRINGPMEIEARRLSKLN